MIDGLPQDLSCALRRLTHRVEVRVDGGEAYRERGVGDYSRASDELGVFTA